MFSKEEEKELKIQFWGGLNEVLEGEKGLHANKVNWMNFNTKIKPLYFRMEADEKGARLCIDIQFIDDDIREIFYEQFTEFSTILNERFANNLKWLPTFEHSNGKTISRIVSAKDGLSMYKKEDWPAMHEFLRSQFVILEHFWSEFGEVFLNLKK
ncbi:DUF4268 domain-containing protein [Crocinitomix sp.]|nr:DUF4268 domain-containing protein [Crocinitomix sp.]